MNDIDILINCAKDEVGYTEMPDDDDLLVGVIFPCEYAEQLNFHTIKEENK